MLAWHLVLEFCILVSECFCWNLVSIILWQNTKWVRLALKWQSQSHPQEVTVLFYTRYWGFTIGKRQEFYPWLSSKDGRSVPQQGWCVCNVHMSPYTTRWCRIHSASGIEQHKSSLFYSQAVQRLQCRALRREAGAVQRSSDFQRQRLFSRRETHLNNYNCRNILEA